VSELFDEVDEEVRRDQLQKLWEKYSIYIVAGALLIIAGVGGWRGYEYLEAQKAAAAGAAPGTAMARPESPQAISVAGLRKDYGAVRAVRDVSFSVARGEIVALLGPNGAGKTTTLEILEGFRTRDGGEVQVLGLDPGDKSAARELRERTGLVLQDIAVEPYLTVRETLARQAGYRPSSDTHTPYPYPALCFADFRTKRGGGGGILRTTNSP